MKVKIDKKEVLLFLLIIPYLKPYNITLIPILDDFFKIWKIISTAYILIIFIKRKSKLHKESIYLFCFCLIWICSLIVNNGPISDYFNNILSVIGLVLVFESNAQSEEFKKYLSALLYKLGAVYMILNCITAIQGYPFFASGMKLDDNANFLGGDNYSAFILIVLSGVMFFYDEKYLNKFRLRTWIYNIIGVISLIIPFAVTGIISYIFLLAMLLLHRFNLVKKIITWKSILFLGGVFVLAISYFRLDVILANMLGAMDKTGFNGRNMIWPMTIAAIIKKPLIGYGGLTEQQARTWMIAGANHAHNFILQIPFSAGVLGSVFFALFIVKILKDTIRRHTNSMNILLMTLSAFLLCSIFDFYIGLIYFYLLFYMIWLEKREKSN